MRTVSVIIPTHHQWALLEKCLTALTQQTYPATLVETIVVVNEEGPTPKTLASRFPEVKFITELSKGSYAARNSGIDNSTGELVAFTDSDCLPHKDWLSEGVKALLENPGAGFVGGQIRVFFQRPNQPTVLEIYDAILSLNQERFVKQMKFAATANMLTFRHLFQEIGKFNPQLLSGGDRLWGNQAYQGGYQPIYCEKAIVEHPGSQNLRVFLNRVRRIEGGHYCLGSIPSPATDNTKEPQGVSFEFDVYRQPLLGKRRSRIQFYLLLKLIEKVKMLERLRLASSGGALRQLI